jgi:hypothetical protein
VGKTPSIMEVIFVMKCELTAEDIMKVKKAYDYLSRIIELTDEYNRKRDIPRKPSTFVTEAHKYLGEVLYGE